MEDYSKNKMEDYSKENSSYMVFYNSIKKQFPVTFRKIKSKGVAVSICYNSGTKISDCGKILKRFV